MSQLQIETDTSMPPFGVAEALVPDWKSSTLFEFWLLSHNDNATGFQGPRFWRTAVARECTPDPDSELTFVALAPVERRIPRTALVRVAL
jgi:hypothetical protein